jgi:hypothetical protein
MTSTFDTHPATFPARRPYIRLAFGALFWRLMGMLTLLFALAHGSFVARNFPPGHRVFPFLVFMPVFAAFAFFLAAVATVVVDLVVRLIVRPRLMAWHAPRGEDFGSAFHLDPRERPVAESPARMSIGRSWPPGRLVLTDRRLLFLPNAWDVEPWSSPRDRLQAVYPAVPPRTLWGLVRGIPPRLEVLADGRTCQFALLDAPAWCGLVAG